MTPASRLKVQPGERVLDLCAAHWAVRQQNLEQPYKERAF